MATTFVKLQQMAMKNNWPSCSYLTNQKYPETLCGYLVKTGPKRCEIAILKRFSFSYTETEIEKEVERTGVRPMSTSYYTDGDGVVHTKADYYKTKIVRCKARKETVKLLFPEPRNHMEPSNAIPWNWERKRLIKHEGYNPRTLKRCPTIAEQRKAALEYYASLEK
tara:strand:- start:320 stop:817 length:498 start_codon:yes stop_codon:yes gene_type:complete